MNITVALKNEKKRYEAAADGQLAGFISYEPEGDVLDLHHTEVFPEYEGQGVGTELVKQTLDLVRTIGKKVKPSCPFIKEYIDKNADYQDLLA
ncbi:MULTISPECIES: GNAT family N-acetyltransferase [unclassified Luteococcus]|uniref:GNAT family N-acetyltransferase n=1 Tax=unclassified Luteococcus TaxID=2639923 RepID=UPI00313C1524